MLRSWRRAFNTSYCLSRQQANAFVRTCATTDDGERKHDYHTFWQVDEGDRRAGILKMYRSFFRQAGIMYRYDPMVAEYISWRARYVFKSRKNSQGSKQVNGNLREGRKYLRVVKRSMNEDRAMEKLLRLSYGKTGRVMHLLKNRVDEAKRNQNLVMKHPDRFYNGLPVTMKEYFDFCARQALEKQSTRTSMDEHERFASMDGAVVHTRPLNKQSKKFAIKERKRGWYYDIDLTGFIEPKLHGMDRHRKRLYARALELSLPSLPVVEKAYLAHVLRPFD